MRPFFIFILGLISSQVIYSQTHQGLQVAHQLGSEAQEIFIGTSSIDYHPNQWSSLYGIGIALGEYSLDTTEYFEASLLRINIGLGLMKNIGPQDLIHQLWEVQLIPGYESWKKHNGQSGDNFTFGTFISPRLALLYSRVLVSAGVFGEYHLGSQLQPINYGLKTQFSFFYSI